MEFDDSLEISDTEKMNEHQKKHLLMGFDFIHRRIREILKHDIEFDWDCDMYNMDVRLAGHGLEVYVAEEIRDRYGDMERQTKHFNIPYDHFFSVSGEEQFRNDQEIKKKEEARIAAEKWKQDQEALRIATERKVEAAEKALYLKLKQKFGE